MILANIEECDSQKSVDYKKRTTLVYQALALASSLEYNCGIRVDDLKWPVVVIELPEIGEVAWHCKASDLVYDNHNTEEKYRRIKDFLSNCDGSM